MSKKESNPIPTGIKKPPLPPTPPAKRLINEDKCRGNNKKEKTTITLRDNEAALVMDSDSNIKIYFPDMGDEDVVPDYVQFMSAIAVVATTDEEVIELIWKKFYELADKEN